MLDLRGYGSDAVARSRAHDPGRARRHDAGAGYDLVIDLNPFFTGVITIGFIYGAFAAEVFRGSFLALPHGQIEAAMAVGMGPALNFRRVVLPQMWRFVLIGA